MRRIQKKKEGPQDTRHWFVKRNSIFLVVGVALAAVLLSGYFLDNDSRDRARILRIQGDVAIERAQGRIPPAVGTVLSPKDKIITGAGSFIELAYDDTHKDVLRIGSDTSVVMESVVIEKQTDIFMYQGEIMLKLEKLEKGSTFKIRTPTAVAGVRGTSFAVQLRGKEKEALITDFESRIFVKGLTEDFLEMKDELFLSEGWKVRVKQFEKPSRVERITPEEYAAWQGWLNEIQSLSKDAQPDNDNLARLASRGEALYERHTTLTAGLMSKVTSSSSVLAFLLYVALAANIGKIFQWQISLAKMST